MRAVVTRVARASVEVDGEIKGQIEGGFLVLLGVRAGDTESETVKIADKVCGLRVFDDGMGKMNLNLAAVGGEMLVISQFTLYADVRSRRPGFTEAARPDAALPLYRLFIDECRSQGFTVAEGVFGADMKVESVNDGPVTIIFDSDKM